MKVLEEEVCKALQELKETLHTSPFDIKDDLSLLKASAKSIKQARDKFSSSSREYASRLSSNGCRLEAHDEREQRLELLNITYEHLKELNSYVKELSEEEISNLDNRSVLSNLDFYPSNEPLTECQERKTL